MYYNPPTHILPTTFLGSWHLIVSLGDKPVSIVWDDKHRDCLHADSLADICLSAPDHVRLQPKLGIPLFSFFEHQLYKQQQQVSVMKAMTKGAMSG